MIVGSALYSLYMENSLRFCDLILYFSSQDMTRLNTEAAIVCVLAKVEEVLQKGESDIDASQWLALISPLIIKLERAVEVTYSRARAALTLLSIEESGNNVPLLHNIKYRRDVVFSQAVGG